MKPTAPPSNWMWRLATIFGIFACIALVWTSSANAGTDLNDVHVTLSQVFLLFAIGAAWGDQRRQTKDIKEELDIIRKKVYAE